MAVPETTVWDRDPHTEAKHRVLSGYYDAWYPIMTSRFPRLTVFEGYAGPGIYTKCEDGSPVIALSNLVERSRLLQGGTHVRFVFVEERKDRLDKLAAVIGERFPQLPGGITVDFMQGACENIWDKALDQADAWGMPIFANLDPFGPGVPYTLVERLGKNRSSEVLVTFMSDWLRRFASLEELDDGDVQFGSKAWRKVGDLSDPVAKEHFLVEEYRLTLARAGFTLTTPFKLTDEGGRSFYLIFGTGHLTGLDRMKASMWRTDPVRGIQYRDPRDPNQGILDFGTPAPDVSPLIRVLTAELAGPSNGRTVEELKDFTLRNTAFRPPHATEAIKRMIERGDLVRSPANGQLTKAVRVSLPTTPFA